MFEWQLLAQLIATESSAAITAAETVIDTPVSAVRFLPQAWLWRLYRVCYQPCLAVLVLCKANVKPRQWPVPFLLPRFMIGKVVLKITRRLYRAQGVTYNLKIRNIVFWSVIVIAFTSGFSQIQPLKADNAEMIDVDIATFNFPPNTHTSLSGRVSGPSAETIRYICERGNMRCTFRMLPAARAYQRIEKGLSDALTTSKFSRFESCCDFTQWFYPFKTGFLSTDHSVELPISEADLIGKHIIVIRG